MAIIQSNAIGAGSKSVGEITYRQVRGRTIACRRITTNTSKTPKQLRHRAAFKEVGQLAKYLLPALKVGFEETKYGTRRNNFYQSNREYMNYLKGREGFEDLSPLTNLCHALKDTDFEGRVMSAKGIGSVSSKWEWDEDGVPRGELSLSRRFNAGDEIVVAIFWMYTVNGKEEERRKLFRTTLGGRDLKGQADLTKFLVDKELIPELDIFTKIETEATDLQVAITAIVLDGENRADAYLSVMPER